MKHIGLVVCLCVASVIPAHAENDVKNFSLLQNSNGRYVFGQISSFRRDQFMLDTHTGRLWEIVTITGKSSEDSIQVLRPIWYQHGKDFLNSPDQ